MRYWVPRLVRERRVLDVEQPVANSETAVAAQSATGTWYGDALSGLGSLLRLCREVIFTGHIDVHGSQLAGPAFAMACCAFSLLFVILDICIFFIRKRSMFQLEYRLQHTIGLLITVPIAASIVGLLGFFLDLLQPTRAAGITVGIAWPVFLTAFFNTKEAMSRDEDTEVGGEALV